MASSAANLAEEAAEREYESDADSELPRGGSRLGRVAVSLLQVHAQIAKRELARDQGRLVAGAVLVALGALLVASVIVLLQVLAVTLLEAHGLSLSAAVLVMAAADATLGGLLLLLGARALRRPLMPETRSLVRRTLGALISQ